MPSTVERIIDSRAAQLAEAIEHYAEVLAGVYSPPGSGPSLTDQMTTEEAYKFWTKYRYEDLGKEAVAQMTPDRVAELDNFLAQETARRHRTPGML